MQPDPATLDPQNLHSPPEHTLGRSFRSQVPQHHAGGYSYGGASSQPYHHHNPHFDTNAGGRKGGGAGGGGFGGEMSSMINSRLHEGEGTRGSGGGGGGGGGRETAEQGSIPQTQMQLMENSEGEEEEEEGYYEYEEEDEEEEEEGGGGGGSGRSKRHKGENREGDSGGDGNRRAKKRRKYINKACDNCRTRHSRCDGKERCSQCVKKGFVCSYSAPPTRRGPVSERQLQDLIAQLTKQIESEKQIKKDWKDKYNRVSSSSNPGHGAITVPTSDRGPGLGSKGSGGGGGGGGGSRGGGEGSSASRTSFGPGWGELTGSPSSSSSSSSYMSQGWSEGAHLALSTGVSTYIEAYNRYITRHISAHPLIFEPGNVQRVLSSESEQRTPLAFQMFAVLANGARVTRNVAAGKEFSMKARAALGAVFDQTDALVAQGLMILSYYMSGEAEADKTMYYLQLARKMCQHLKTRTSEYYMLILMTIGFASPHTEEKMEVFSELKLRLSPLMEARSGAASPTSPSSSHTVPKDTSAPASSSSSTSSATSGPALSPSVTPPSSQTSSTGLNAGDQATADGGPKDGSSSDKEGSSLSLGGSANGVKPSSNFTMTLAIISVQLELELVKLPTEYNAEYPEMLQVLDKLKRKLNNDKDTSYSKLGFLIFLEVIRAQCYCNLGLREMAVECTNKVSELAKHSEFPYCPIGVLGGVAMMATIQLQENKLDQVREHIARMKEMAATYPFVRFMAQKLQEALQDKLSKAYGDSGLDLNMGFQSPTTPIPGASTGGLGITPSSMPIPSSGSPSLLPASDMGMGPSSRPRSPVYQHAPDRGIGSGMGRSQDQVPTSSQAPGSGRSSRNLPLDQDHQLPHGELASSSPSHPSSMLSSQQAPMHPSSQYRYSHAAASSSGRHPLPPDSYGRPPPQRDYLGDHMAEHMMGQLPRSHIQEQSLYLNVPENRPSSHSYHSYQPSDQPPRGQTSSYMSPPLPDSMLDQGPPYLSHHMAGRHPAPLSSGYDYDHRVEPERLPMRMPERSMPQSAYPSDHGPMLRGRGEPSMSHQSSLSSMDDQEEYRRLQQHRSQLEREVQHERHNLQLQQQQHQLGHHPHSGSQQSYSHTGGYPPQYSRSAPSQHYPPAPSRHQYSYPDHGMHHPEQMTGDVMGMQPRQSHHVPRSGGADMRARMPHDGMPYGHSVPDGGPRGGM